MNKKYGFSIIVILIFSIIISGCSSDNNLVQDDIIYKFAGSLGIGDFINVEINMTEKTFKYENRIEGDKGQGTFSSISKNLYKISSSQAELNGNNFLLLNDEIILVSVPAAGPGERMITALKEVDSAYGNEISGDYNIATSMEGAVGTVSISPNNNDSSQGQVDITFNSSKLVDLSDIPYEFDNKFNALKILESNNFRHYGVFYKGEIGVFDSYMWENGEWAKDGMSFLVKQDPNITLGDFTGSYTFIDVDGDKGAFDISGDDTEVNLTVAGEDTSINIKSSDLNNGIISKNCDLIGSESGTQDWNFMLIPGKIIIAATENKEAFGGDGGGFAVGIKIKD